MAKDKSIYELLVRQHYGQLAEEDQALLEQEISDNPEIQELKSWILKVPSEEAKALTKGIDKDLAIYNILQRASRLKKKRKIIQGMIIYPILAIIALTGALILHKSIRNPHPEVDQSSPGNGTEWIFPNGSKIKLAANGKRLVAVAKTSFSDAEGQTYSYPGDPEKLHFGYTVVKVPRKLDLQVELPDGSNVWINSDTEFRFPLVYRKAEQRGRNVYLAKGEAYFDIVSDPKAPFYVNTPHGQIQVLGTSFNVNVNDESQVKATLVSGKIRAKGNGSDPVDVPPNHQVIFTSTGTVVSACDPRYAISWKEGFYYFNDTPVLEVIDMMERWFDIKVVTDGPEFLKRRLRGKMYRDKPVTSFINQINATGEVYFYWQNDVLHCGQGASHDRKGDFRHVPTVR